jgi:hypothetical protein
LGHDPLITVAVDALCKLQLEPVKLDVRHRLDRLHRRRETRTAGLCAEGAHPGCQARLHCDRPADTRGDHQMAGQARRRDMARPATHGELASR